MKRIYNILALMSLIGLSALSFAQKTNTNDLASIKGEFQIGLNDFALTEDWGSRFKIRPRLGYSISDKDMIFVDFTYSEFNINLKKGSNFESSLNYRRYLKSGQFRPFVQIGIGGGYEQYHKISDNIEISDQYLKAETGTGVSYRYKRWTFEVGVKANYNEFGNGRVQFAPMIGVSFSF